MDETGAIGAARCVHCAGFYVWIHAVSIAISSDETPRLREWRRVRKIGKLGNFEVVKKFVMR